ASGSFSLFSNTLGYDNTANGFSALYSNTVGYNNTANGLFALYSNTEGHNNTAQGAFALSNSINAVNNSAIGSRALEFLDSGFNNVAFGVDAMKTKTSGFNNVAIGTGSLYTNATGNSNTVLGVDAGYGATGSGNVFLGYNAGGSETGNNKLYINNDGANANNALIYGEFDTKKLQINGNLTINNAIGNSIIKSGVLTILSDGSVYSFNGTGGTVTSDKRLKQDIDLIPNSLAKILQLNGYAYRFKTKANVAQKELGVLAQEVMEVLPEAVFTNEEGIHSVSYSSLIPVLINAVKEQNDIIKKADMKVKALEEKIANLEASANDMDKVKSLESKLARLEEMVKALSINGK
ncbi:MAG TPA: tail fiber domain-containing protein, partial [Saprospiraceae bacterium]|nr:tail fiber domain-containing protein [Saprospiraceae bacterium]